MPITFLQRDLLHFDVNGTAFRVVQAEIEPRVGHFHLALERLITGQRRDIAGVDGRFDDAIRPPGMHRGQREGAVRLR